LHKNLCQQSTNQLQACLPLKTQHSIEQFPFWWQDAKPEQQSEEQLPESADVAIVGAGYTGLNAALVLARAGRKCIVLDKTLPGEGCSTRNGGQIGDAVGVGYSELSKSIGKERATSIVQSGHDALAWLKQFIKTEQLDCDFSECGRFYGAHTEPRFKTLENKLADVPDGLSINASLISKDEQHNYIGSDYYYGGLYYHKHCSLHPAKFHQQLLARVRTEDCQVIGNTEVLEIRATENKNTLPGLRKFRLKTSRGSLEVDKVLVATNGYSTNLIPWLRRRIIPIGSYMIATEKLAESDISQMIPAGRVVTDTRKLVVYYRPCPDNERIIFGARVSIAETDPLKTAGKLHKQLCQRFPACESVKITHSWMGYVGYTFDSLPHIGEHEGVHYAMGYCGSGVAMAGYCGAGIARQMLGKNEIHPLSQTPFQSRFYYRKKPWFLSPSLAWYGLRDAMQR